MPGPHSMELDVCLQYSHITQEVENRISPDLLMLAIRDGFRCNEFCQMMHEWGEQALESDEWRNLVNEGNNTQIWQYIMDHMQSITKQLFGTDNQKPEYHK